MENRNEITDELVTMDSPLAYTSRVMPYAVPHGYFEELPTVLLKTVVADTEIIGLPPLQNPFNAPKGYFDAFPAHMLKKAKATGKTIRIYTKNSNVWSQARLAAAAVLMLGIGIGSYKYYTDRLPYNTEMALGAVPQTAINEYVKQNIDDFDMDMIVTNLSAGKENGQISKEEITKYLDENGWDTP